MMNEKLRLPASCTRLSAETCASTEGGCFIRLSTVCFMLSKLFQSNRGYEIIDEEAVLLQQEHGDIVGLQHNVYTYADGYTYAYSVLTCTMKKASVSDFFYNLGDIWRSMGL